MLSRRPAGSMWRSGGRGESYRDLQLSAIADAKRCEMPFARAVEIVTQGMESRDEVVALAAAKAMADMRARARADALAKCSGDVIDAEGEAVDNAVVLTAEEAIEIAHRRREAALAAKAGGNGHGGNGHG